VIGDFSLPLFTVGKELRSPRHAQSLFRRFKVQLSTEVEQGNSVRADIGHRGIFTCFQPKCAIWSEKTYAKMGKIYTIMGLKGWFAVCAEVFFFLFTINLKHKPSRKTFVQ